MYINCCTWLLYNTSFRNLHVHNVAQNVFGSAYLGKGPGPNFGSYYFNMVAEPNSFAGDDATGPEGVTGSKEVPKSKPKLPEATAAAAVNRKPFMSLMKSWK